jgi:hypothetical protein
MFDFYGPHKFSMRSQVDPNGRSKYISSAIDIALDSRLGTEQSGEERTDLAHNAELIMERRREECHYLGHLGLSE